MGPLWKTISPTPYAEPRKGFIATPSPITLINKISPSLSFPITIASKSGIGLARNALHHPTAFISNNETCWPQL